MSQEADDLEIYNGRLDAQRLRQLHDAFLGQANADDVFLCGPNPMIDELTEALIGLGYRNEQIHSERFRAGMKGEQVPRPRGNRVPDGGTEVSVIMDGQRQAFHMQPGDGSILDAGQKQGIDLPYSCKGGVCSTCRCRLVDGDVDMAVNYALEQWELDQGFVLTCQSTPKTGSLTLDFDQT